MNEKDVHEEFVRALHQELGMVDMHRHVLDRMAGLLSPAEIVWADGSIETGDDGVSGKLVVFTDSLVAVATLRDEIQSGDTYKLSGPPLPGSTDVALFPRHALTKVRSTTGESRNRPEVWMRRDRNGFPQYDDFPRYGAPVELEYGSEVVTVNDLIGSRRGGFKDFLGTVMRDMAGPPRE